MNKENETKFKWRGFTTFLLTFSFLVMVFSGVVLYLVPAGSIASWTGWRFLGLEKDLWASVHMNSCLLFLVAALVHLYFNWKVFLLYLGSRGKQYLRLKRELAVAFILCGIFTAGAIVEIAPFGTVFEIRESFKHPRDKAWQQAKPVHTRESDLKRLALRLGVSLEELRAVLRKNGLRVEQQDSTITEVAKRNSLPPEAIYEAAYLEYGEYLKPRSWSLPTAPRRFAETPGRGFGRLRLEDFCLEKGLKTESVIAFLKERGVRATPMSTLRELSLALGTTPRGVVEILSRETR